VVIECIDPRDIEVKSCYEKQSPGTAARYSCAPYYRPTADLPTLTEKCDENGKWTPGVYKQFTCVPDCGISEVPKTAYIYNGQSTKRGQWPWHAAIYLMHKGTPFTCMLNYLGAKDQRLTGKKLLYGMI